MKADFLLRGKKVGTITYKKKDEKYLDDRIDYFYWLKNKGNDLEKREPYFANDLELTDKCTNEIEEIYQNGENYEETIKSIFLKDIEC